MIRASSTGAMLAGIWFLAHGICAIVGWGGPAITLISSAIAIGAGLALLSGK